MSEDNFTKGLHNLRGVLEDFVEAALLHQSASGEGGRAAAKPRRRDPIMEESKLGGPGGEGGEQMTEQQVIGTYRGMLNDVNQMRRKIAELQQDMAEHQ